MNRYQKGGSVIFDVDTGLGVPNVSYVPTLDLPELKTTALSSAIDTYTKIKETEQDAIKSNLDGLTKAYDDISKVRYDNEPQKAIIDAAKQRVGLTEDIFNMSAEQLKNPYIMAPVSRATSDFLNDPSIRPILHEQIMVDAAVLAVKQKPPADPKLLDMFKKDLDLYHAGKKSGLEINPGQYEDLDIGADLAKRLKELPTASTSDVVDTDFATYEREVTSRSRESIMAVLADRKRDPIFRNNMIARGYFDEQGELTTAGSEYLEAIADAYAQEQIKISGLKGKSTAAKGSYGKDPTPSATAGLTGLDGALYNGFYNIASEYGVALDDPGSAKLNMEILANIQNSKKDGKVQTSDEVVKSITRSIRKAAIRSGNGIQALYDAAVDEGYAGTLQDLEDLIIQNDWTTASTAGLADANVVKALTGIVGSGNEQQSWDRLKNGPQASQQITPDTSAQGQSPATTQGGGIEELKISSLFLGEYDNKPDFGYNPQYTGDEDDDYLNFVKQHEATGNTNARNDMPGQTAGGLFGFTDPTWKQVTKDWPEAKAYKMPNGELKPEWYAKKFDAKIAEKAFKQLTKTNRKVLEKEGLSDDRLNIYMVHHFGPSGGPRLLKAPRNAMAKDHMSADAYRANPYVHGKTVQQVLDHNAGVMGLITENTFDSRKYRYYKTWKSLGGTRTDKSGKQISTKGDRLDARIPAILDQASAMLGRQIKVTNDYRTVEETKRLQAAGYKASDHSKHKEGHGMDIDIASMTTEEKKKVLQFLIDKGARGIGFYHDGHLHFDLRGGKNVVVFGGPKPSWTKGII